MKPKNKNQSFLSRLFSHNIALLIVALLITFTAWFIIKITSGEETPKTILDIPITVELPESLKNEGYKIYGLNGEANPDDDGDLSELTATVNITGNPIVVAGLTADDIKVSASQTTTIISPGTYNLPLTAKKASLKSDYTFNIESFTPDSVTVYVDTEKEAEFTIQNKMKVQIKDSNHYADVTLSTDKVTVTGPKTQVNEIKSVCIEGNVSGETSTLQQKLVYYGENDEKLDLPYVTADTDTVEVSINVQPVKTVDLKVDLQNAPEKHPEIKISPSTLKISGSKDVLDGISEDAVSIATLDFNELKNEEHELDFDITLPEGCKSIEKVTSATVSIDLSDYESRTLLAKVSNTLDSSKYTTEFTSGDSVYVTIYGPSDVLDEISASDITVETDFTELPKSMSSGNAVSLTIPLNASLSKEFKKDCWVYEPSEINVNVTKK